jgi:hypothetical protein
VAAVSAAVAVAALVLVGTSSAGAAGTNSGAAVPTNPADNTPLTSGGSATEWTLNLPAQAACSGDTANQGFHIFSYVVPASVDPATLTFNAASGPSSGNPLVDVTGSAYTAKNTAVNTGQVTQIPSFDWRLFATTDQGGTRLALPPGGYNVGIACANTTGQGDRFWNVVVTFTASASDPNGETWATSSQTTTTTSTSSSSSSSSSSSLSSSSPSVSSDTTGTTGAGGGGGTTTTPPAGVSGVGDPAGAGPITTNVAPLARTGSHSLPSALVGGALTYIGIVVVLLARRRRLAST